MKQTNVMTRDGEIFQLKMRFLDKSEDCLLWEVERHHPSDVIILETPTGSMSSMKSLYVRDGFHIEKDELLHT